MNRRSIAGLLTLILACACTGPPLPDADLDGMEPDVAAAIEKARAEVRRRPSAESWGALGATFHAHGLGEQAVACYEAARDAAPADFRWPYLQAIALESSGGDAQLLDALLRRALELQPDYAAGWLRLGLVHARQGRHTAAGEALRRAVELQPDSAGAQRALGQTLLALGDVEKAVDRLARAAWLRPDDAAAFSSLAAAYRRLGERELAAEAAARAAHLTPRPGFDDPVLQQQVRERGVSASLRFERARRLVAAGQTQQARELAERILELRPTDPDVHVLIGTIARREDRRDEAGSHLARALELNPQHLQALDELAGLHEREGRLEPALRLRRQAHELSPRDPSLLIALARTLERSQDVDGLIAAFEKLARLMPEAAGVRVSLGTAYGRAGAIDRAAAEFREALRLDPDSVEGHYRLGVALETQGRVDEARREYETTLRLDSTHVAVQRLARLGGATDAGAALSPRQELQRIAEELRAGENPYLGRGRIERQRRRVEEAASEDERIEARVQLSAFLLQEGEVDAAVEQIETALAALPPDASPARRVELLRFHGLVYMRRAEVQNCVARHNPDCCIFPLRQGGVHALREPARQARDSFARVLDLEPDDLASRWLLNVMSMALGEYPQAVDPAHRLPPEAFESQHDVGRFRDVAPALGVDTFNQCGGAIADDFDGDGRLDIVTSTFDPAGPLTFYANDGRGGFVDRSRPSGAAQQLGGLNIVGADYDNDGDVDVLVLRGAWLLDDGRIRNSLLRNDGGRFTDVTRAAGLARPAYPTQAAAWGDYDNDGDLDLYVCNESRKHQPLNKADYPSQLFLNDGDGRFVDVAREAGVTNDGYCKGVSAGDYDNDGDLDLYLSNVGDNRLYRNDGGRFVDVAREAGVREPAGRSFATWFFDYDNDGWLDLFVAAYDADIADLAAAALGRPHSAALPRLYRNAGNGRFVDVTAAVGLARPWLPMGANFGDLDNDGWLDIYLTTGDPSYRSLMPNVMLRNDDGRRFQDVTTSGGFGHLQKGHGVAFADFDDDGDQDIYHQLGGFYPGDAFHNALFENPGHGGRWLALKLVGTRSNRAGLGARVVVAVETADGRRREIHRAAGSVSSFGGSPSRLEIGLGDAVAIERVEVFWPVSQTRQRFEAVEPDGLLQITEGSATPQRLALKPLRFRTD